MHPGSDELRCFLQAVDHLTKLVDAVSPLRSRRLVRSRTRVVVLGATSEVPAGLAFAGSLYMAE
jgi:hypothetical protein